MNSGCIYIIISPNNSIYIGQTTNFKKRKSRYRNLSCKQQPKLYNSLMKYGFDNHLITIIEDNINKNLLNDVETDYIKLYDSFNNGMNLTSGGGCNHIRSEETINKLKIAATGNKNNVGKKNALGYKHTDDAKIRISESKKNRKSHWVGKSQSEEHKSKIAVAKHKKVLKFDIDGNFLYEYNSLKEASTLNNLGSSNISMCCNGKRKSCGNFIWSYK